MRFLFLCFLVTPFIFADPFSSLPMESSEEQKSVQKDPGTGLAPEDQFARIPLRPPMSLSNWKKWAGPAVDKVYRVRKGENLHDISRLLFGTPYLWPKIWQLNARIGNAHYIDPGLELYFKPGNPFSAPLFAFQAGEQGDYIALKAQDIEDVSSFWELQRRYYSLSKEADPLLRHVFRARAPRPVALVPEHTRSPLSIYREGDLLELKHLPSGNYSVVKMEEKKDWTFVRILGVLEVKDWSFERPLNAYVKKAYREIQKGDLILNESFQLKPMRLSLLQIGRRARQNTTLIPQYDEARWFSHEGRTLGVRFSKKARAPELGATMDVMRGNERIASVVLIQKDKHIGTLFVLDSLKEIEATDQIL